MWRKDIERAKANNLIRNLSPSEKKEVYHMLAPQKKGFHPVLAITLAMIALGMWGGTILGEHFYREAQKKKATQKLVEQLVFQHIITKEQFKEQEEKIHEVKEMLYKYKAAQQTMGTRHQQRRRGEQCDHTAKDGKDL